MKNDGIKCTWEEQGRPTFTGIPLGRKRECAHWCYFVQRVLDKGARFAEIRESKQAVLPGERRDKGLAFVQELMRMARGRGKIVAKETDVLGRISW